MVNCCCLYPSYSLSYSRWKGLYLRQLHTSAFFYKTRPRKVNSINFLSTKDLGQVTIHKFLSDDAPTKQANLLKKPEDILQPEKMHLDRNFITATRAMSVSLSLIWNYKIRWSCLEGFFFQEFFLKPEHLLGLRMTNRRSPSGFNHSINVFWRRDVEAKAMEVWGSKANLEAQRVKLEVQKAKHIEIISR